MGICDVLVVHDDKVIGFFWDTVCALQLNENGMTLDMNKYILVVVFFISLQWIFFKVLTFFS